MTERIRRTALALAAMAMFAACGGSRTPGSEQSAKAGGASSAPPAATAAPPQPMQLTPLTQDDVKLYLDVMEAAAERVLHPTPEDQKITAQANKAMMNAKPGQALPPDDGRAMVRFTTMMTNMDLIVAEQRRVDARRYEGIRGIVEAVIPNPASSMLALAKDYGPAAGAAPADPRVRDAEEAAATVLQPYKARIERAESAVRKSGSLPR
jgi:hypothetical protein